MQHSFLMIHHSELRHFRVTRFAVAVVAIRVNTDPATRSELAPYFYVFRFHQSNEVFHNDVDAIFMKRTMIAETEQVQFQAFTFYHPFAGNVLNVYGGKIGLRGNGAKACKFRAVETYPVIVVRMRILEGFEDVGVVSELVFGFVTKKHFFQLKIIYTTNLHVFS